MKEQRPPAPAHAEGQPSGEEGGPRSWSQWPTCATGSGGRRVGCRRSCSCRWWEQCYTKHSAEVPSEDTGVCQLSMLAVSIFTVVLVGSLVCLTVNGRLLLQYREYLNRRGALQTRVPRSLLQQSSSGEGGGSGGGSISGWGVSNQSLVDKIQQQRLTKKQEAFLPKDRWPHLPSRPSALTNAEIGADQRICAGSRSANAPPPPRPIRFGDDAGVDGVGRYVQDSTGDRF